MTEPVEPDPDTGASNAGESDRPTVSLVISVWNRQQDLRENLAAIRQQTRAPEQVIVVDNDSTDGTPEMVVADGQGGLRMWKQQPAAGGPFFEERVGVANPFDGIDVEKKFGAAKTPPRLASVRWMSEMLMAVEWPDRARSVGVP